MRQKIENALVLLVFVLGALLLTGATIIVKISEFPGTATLNDTDMFVVASGTTNRHISWADLKVLIGEAATVTITTNNYTYVSNTINNDTYVSNYVTTNVYFDTYVSNYITTNFYTTNNTWTYEITTNNYWTWTTNLFVSNSYVSNFFQTNIFYNDTYVSNYYITNFTSWTTNYHNRYVTNVYITLNTTNLTTTNLTVILGMTNLSLTPNTVLKADLNRRIVSIVNAAGALTNNGSGTFGWFNDFATHDEVNSASNSILSQMTNTINSTSNSILDQFTNTINSTSNSILSEVTNLVGSVSNFTTIIVTNSAVVGQLDYFTNACTMAPDFSKGYCWITTNAAFTFLLPIGFDATQTKALTTVMVVTNSSGAAIAATAPENVHVVPNSVMWVTNVTSFTWFYYPFVGTNVYAVPLF